MKPNSVIRFASVLAYVGLLHVPTAGAATEKVLYSFGAGTSYAVCPTAALINVKGFFYGTTNGGPVAGGIVCATDYGSVFSINLATGAETDVHKFGNNYGPVSNLINVKGALYGTTYGNPRDGKVFDVDPTTDTVTVVHRFNGKDGAEPLAGLINVKGILYGTTSIGGGVRPCPGVGPDCGTVFSINPTTGAETVLYAFKGGRDGAEPTAGLVEVNGTLYGTTAFGGSATKCDGGGCGTVFSFNPTTSTETVIYAFKGGNGYDPAAGLINVDGTLYGTTVLSVDKDGYMEPGTVFSVNPTTGAEKVVYSFKGGNDGGLPEASLINVNGTLYGTTAAGGGAGCGNSLGCGTVFSITP